MRVNTSLSEGDLAALDELRRALGGASRSAAIRFAVLTALAALAGRRRIIETTAEEK